MNVCLHFNVSSAIDALNISSTHIKVKALYIGSYFLFFIYLIMFKLNPRFAKHALPKSKYALLHSEEDQSKKRTLATLK